MPSENQQLFSHLVSTKCIPSGIVQNVAEQKGTFVEVKGYGHQMEGVSRPTFFRGVATVVTKLFNIIQVSPFPGLSRLDPV
jgi:pantothenate synthetase